MDKDIETHVQGLNKVNGKRLEIFDRIEIPSGWVATTSVPQGFWNKCKTFAIPMKPTRVLGIFPTASTSEMKRWISKYGNRIMVVLIPDEEAFESYSGGPILLDDLERNPHILLDESLTCIGKDGTLADMKRRCAMLLYGWVDTK